MPSPKKHDNDNLGRPSHFDYSDEAERESDKNKYCSKAVLHNEANVEDFFVLPLLKDLGYANEEIRPKESLMEITVARGHAKEQYRPDYALICHGTPRWVLDAKTPGGDMDRWTYQGARYALGINQQYMGDNPCHFYVLTNRVVF